MFVSRPTGLMEQMCDKFYSVIQWNLNKRFRCLFCATSSILASGIVAAVDRVVERSFAGEVPPTADGGEPNTAAPVAPRIRLSTKELSKLLWANARLDHRAAYNQRAADEFIAQSAHLKLASNAGVQILSRTLWAMAVLEVLTYEVSWLTAIYLMHKNIFP